MDYLKIAEIADKASKKIYCTNPRAVMGAQATAECIYEAISYVFKEAAKQSSDGKTNESKDEAKP